MRPNGPPFYVGRAKCRRAGRGSGSDMRTASDSLYDDLQQFGTSRGTRSRFSNAVRRAGSLETCGFKQRFWSLLGLRPKVTRARGHGASPSAAGRNGTAGGITLNPPHSRCRSHVPQGKFPRSFCTVKVLYTSCDFPSRTPTTRSCFLYVSAREYFTPPGARKRDTVAVPKISVLPDGRRLKF